MILSNANNSLDYPETNFIMLKNITLITIALLAFAGNSVLCRLALGEQTIDAASFTSIRLLSGAIFLLLLVYFKEKKLVNIKNGSWFSAISLFFYAATFSFAYISLDTGTGALILFGLVQITMVVYSFIQGKKLVLAEWLGLIIAFSGLLVLLLPGASSPSLTGFSLMAISGVAWAVYTIQGRGSQTPLQDTATNFLKTLPLVVLMVIVTIQHVDLSYRGVILAIASGAITSGLGYAIWYAVLKNITVMQASTSQLLVPIIASIAGVLFANEIVTSKLLIASLLILGGILVLTLGKQINQKKIE